MGSLVLFIMQPLVSSLATGLPGSVKAATSAHPAGTTGLSERERKRRKVLFSLNHVNIDLGYCFGKIYRIFCLSVQFSCPVMADSLRPHELQHARLPCPSPTPGAHPNSCPLSQWCHPTISSSLVPFSCPQSFPASGSFQMSQLFASGGRSTGVSASASVLPVNTQDWYPLGWTGWISLQSKGLFNKESSPAPQFKSTYSLALSFLHCPTHIHTWLLEKS